jgi:DNA-binding protein YbaB
VGASYFHGCPKNPYRGTKVEGAVTIDIRGKKDLHSLRLDKEAIEPIRKARIHQKVASTVFFESLLPVF